MSSQVAIPCLTPVVPVLPALAPLKVIAHYHGCTNKSNEATTQDTDCNNDEEEHIQITAAM